ncbi:MAG: hypothetical protein Q9227_008276 [Pyrenula ochraceoflavens]
MSFQASNNVPHFATSQRAQEDAYWRASSRGGYGYKDNAGSFSNGDIGSKINDFFGSNGKELPLYKDKPHYAARRRRGFFQQKRTVAYVILLVLGFFWWLKAPPSVHLPASHDFSKSADDILAWVEKADSQSKNPDWRLRKDLVREAFRISWDGYKTYAWGLDEYHPLSKGGRNMVEGGLGWIIVDALDTAMLMNLTEEVKSARDWMKTSLHYTADHEVNTFETTIRMLGGLLSAHYISTTYPTLAPQTDDDIGQSGEDLYIEIATDLADRILGAFDTPSGVPVSSINLNTSVGASSHVDAGAASTAEAATLQLEFKYLAKLTGEPHLWSKVETVMEVISNQHMPGGLLPIYIYPTTGGFRGENIRLGSRGDSYYEYLIKQYLQTSSAEPVYLHMWDEALAGIKKHLLTYTKHGDLTVLAERQNGLSKPLTPKMDHLVCFMPGTIALAVTGGTTVEQAKKKAGRIGWGPAQEADLALARELMKTCWAMYKATSTGLAAEITYFEVDDPPRMYGEVNTPTSPLKKTRPKSEQKNDGDSPKLSDGHKAKWRKDVDIHSNDVHNLQRPETVESLFYMYRITRDPIYREWGWEMFRSFIRHTAVRDKVTEKVYAFTSLGNVLPRKIRSLGDDDEDDGDDDDDDDDDDEKEKKIDERDLQKRDNMESFWLAETLKYFYLLFAEEDFVNLEDVVINTEAHVFPRFEMGSKFATGWSREGKKEEKEGKEADGGEGEKKEKKEKEGEGKVGSGAEGQGAKTSEKVIKVEEREAGKAEAEGGG